MKFNGTGDETFDKFIQSILPMIGKKYIHYKNKNTYTILGLTNIHSTFERIERHPIDVIYQGSNGNIWSRPLTDWNRSFKREEHGKES